MSPLTFAIAIAVSLAFVSCDSGRDTEVDDYKVIVEDEHGQPLPNAHVYLSYDSDPSPPKFLTDENGIAKIPDERARKGGWVSIIAVYRDAQETKHMGSLKEPQPAWPVTIVVAPR